MTPVFYVRSGSQITISPFFRTLIVIQPYRIGMNRGIFGKFHRILQEYFFYGHFVGDHIFRSERSFGYSIMGNGSAYHYKHLRFVHMGELLELLSHAFQIIIIMDAMCADIIRAAFPQYTPFCRNRYHKILPPDNHLPEHPLHISRF